MKLLLFRNWSIIRLLRASMGIFATIEAFRSETWIFLIPAAYFIYMAISNKGCNSCVDTTNEESLNTNDKIK